MGNIKMKIAIKLNISSIFIALTITITLLSLIEAVPLGGICKQRSPAVNAKCDKGLLCSPQGNYVSACLKPVFIEETKTAEVGDACGSVYKNVGQWRQLVGKNHCKNSSCINGKCQKKEGTLEGQCRRGRYGGCNTGLKCFYQPKHRLRLCLKPIPVKTVISKAGEFCSVKHEPSFSRLRRLGGITNVGKWELVNSFYKCDEDSYCWGHTCKPQPQKRTVPRRRGESCWPIPNYTIYKCERGTTCKNGSPGSIPTPPNNLPPIPGRNNLPPIPGVNNLPRPPMPNMPKIHIPGLPQMKYCL